MRLPVLMGAALLASGCASIQKERGHAEVAALVEERLGRKTHWNQGTPEDAEVSRHLDALLKEDLTSDRAVEVALLNNPALQATYEDLGVSQADMVQAGLLSNPTLSGSIGFPISGLGGLEHEVSLVQNFVELFTLPLRKRVAQEQFVADTLRVAHEALATAAEVRRTFSEVQALQQLVELRRMALRAAETAADLSARLRAAGNITELELASEQAAAEGARLELAEDELALVEAREHLNRLMGLWGPRTQWTLSEKLPELPAREAPLERLESLAIRQRLDIDAARKQAALLWNALELARSTRFFGRVEVGVHEHQDADGPRLVGPTLSLELPIFDQRQALIARLEAQHRQGERRLAELSVNARSEVRAARARLLSLRLVADRYRRVVLPLREKVVEQSQLQYNAMQIGLFQLLTARREQVEAYRGYIEAVRDYWMARAELERLVGAAFPLTPRFPPSPLLSRHGPSSPAMARSPPRRVPMSTPEIDTEHASDNGMVDSPDAPEQSRQDGTPPGTGVPQGLTRRSMLVTTGATLAGGALLLKGSTGHAQAQDSAVARGRPSAKKDWLPPGMPNRDYRPVVVPNGSKAPWKVVDGVKVFHLVAGEVEHEFAPGLKAFCWGYNGRVHGPTLEAVEGDRVRIYVTNRLPAATTIHWHAVLLPNGMDGVGGLNQKSIAPGETFRYEFTLRQSGTAMYHSHHDEMTQIGLGLTGMFVIHPRRPVGPRVDRDFVILLHEWRIDAGTRRPNPNEMTDFNVLTFNARAFPGTEPLVVRQGERVRIRLGNLSPQNHHPIHLHGFHFRITETDGGRIPESAQRPEATVLVPVGSTRTIEFLADEPGDWALHCHMTHHMMNQMGHEFPNMIGVKSEGLDVRARTLLPGYMTMGQTGMAEMGEMGMPVPSNSIPMVGARGKHDYMTMGGMFTVVKVRERLASYEDPGWYDNPPGTLAVLATPDELRRDGIDVDAPPAAESGSPG